MPTQGWMGGFEKKKLLDGEEGVKQKMTFDNEGEES